MGQLALSQAVEIRFHKMRFAIKFLVTLLVVLVLIQTSLAHYKINSLDASPEDTVKDFDITTNCSNGLFRSFKCRESLPINREVF